MQHLAEARAWLASKYGQPAVAVVASAEAERLCGEAHGLTVADLLRPFGVLSELNGGVGVPVRTVGEHPLRLHSWTLRFFGCSTMFQPDPAAAEAHLGEVLTAAVAAAEAEGGPEAAPTLQALVAQATGAGGDPTPWFRAYRSELFRTLSFGDLDTSDHPVASILVLPSTVGGDPVAAFAELHRRAPLPAGLRESVAEAQLLRHFVLLHDAKGPEAGVEEKLKAMRVALGANCHVLSINGGEAGVPPTNPSFFQRFMRDPIPGGGAGEPPERLAVPAGGVGAGLSPSDMTALASFVQDLATRSLVPHLEGRIRLLNQSVTVNRKGLKNQLKSLLWRKPGAGAAADSGATPSQAATGAAAYPATSVEAQMRQLADLAVMLRDYETALSTLRLLASDYKSDRAYRHYAAAQEALGVVTALGAGPASDAITIFKEAFYRYSQAQAANPAPRDCVRYATRTALSLAQYLGALGQHSDASWVLMKAHLNEGNLAAGLMLEQAGHCLLRLSPPHARKFAFYLVLAGLRFNMCGQRGLALRAYRQVLGVYSGRQWRLVEEHLHDVLGKACREAGDLPGAARHYMDTLLCPSNSLYCQRLYLAQFLDIAQKAEAQMGFPPVLELPVPVICLDRVGLQFDSQACYSTPEARRLPARAWAPLEAALQPASEAGPATWLDGGSRVSLAQQQHTCCVGEAVGVDLELSNPLALDLPITRLRLACTFEPAGGAASSSADDGSTKGPGFQVREEGITLRAGERVMIHLRVVPLRPGRLSLDGVAWVLSGVAHAQQAFKIQRPKPTKPGTSKIMLDAEREPPGGISFDILPPMPRLEASVEGLEGTLLAGQVVKATLRLRNTGAMTLKGLRMAAGEGDIFLGSTAGADGGMADGAAESSSAPTGGVEVAMSQRQGVSVFSLPAGCRLGVAQELVLPIWFRPSRPGAACFRFMWHYEPLVRLDALRYRTLRAAYGAAVLPSLQLTADAVRGTSVPGRRLLHLHALNLQSLESFHLRRLVCQSVSWGLGRLEAPAAGPEQQLGMDLTLGPEAAAACYYHITPAGGPPAAAGAVAQAAAPPLSEGERYFQARSGAQAQPSAAAATSPGAGPRQGELSGSMDLMLHWEAAGRPAVQGYTSVSIASVKAGSPIHLQLLGPSGGSVAHDFSAAPICTVPLTLRLRNELPTAATVVIETGRHATAAGEVRTAAVPTWAAARPASSSSGEPSTSSSAVEAVGGAVPPLRQYVWSGRTRITLPSLPGGTTVEVPLHVAAAAPTQLAVNDYIVSWSYPGVGELSGSQGGPPCFVALRGAP